MSKWTIRDTLMYGYVWSRDDYHIVHEGPFCWWLYYGPSRILSFHWFLWMAKLNAYVDARREGRMML